MPTIPTIRRGGEPRKNPANPSARTPEKGGEEYEEPTTDGAVGSSSAVADGCGVEDPNGTHSRPKTYASAGARSTTGSAQRVGDRCVKRSADRFTCIQLYAMH